MAVGKGVIDQVMVSIAEKDAVQPEMTLSSLRHNAHHRLERISRES